MGVDRSDYILLGYDISNQYDELEDVKKDELFDKYQKSRDIILLEDGMSGQYTYFGVILQVDKNGYDGLSPFIFDDDYPIERERIEKAACEEFSIDSEAKLIVLTHWH